jgi:hypothetical protein
MKVGDLVEPRFMPWVGQIGIVMDIGFMGSVFVRFTCGKIKIFNYGCLDILNKGKT